MLGTGGAWNGQQLLSEATDTLLLAPVPTVADFPGHGGENPARTAHTGNRKCGERKPAGREKAGS